MKIIWSSVIAGSVLCAASAVVAASTPHIGFAFPAGAQQGTSIDLLIGGQFLQNATTVLVSGEGVSVEIESYSEKLDPKEHRRLLRQVDNLQQQLKESEGAQREKQERQLEGIKKRLARADLPDGVDPFNAKALQKIFRQGSNKEQFNPQIAGRLRVKVKVDRNAPTGEHELRVDTPAGLSNPFYFQVGTLEEVCETEPNDDHMAPDLQEISWPAVINGQVRPGDIDHFRFRAAAGDVLVVDVGARRIIPYLADAVPGWFQAVVALYDEDGNEVAYQDDYKFNPDPVLFFDVPQSGTYTLSIRDSIYRGREDFIYRIAIGELPFITGIFPLGAQQGSTVNINLSGRNLPKTRVTGTLPEDVVEVRHISVEKDGVRSNQMPFEIGDMKEIGETEPNHSIELAQSVQSPLVINGRIQPADDIDVFSFNGRKGDTVSIKVNARKLNSPLDSMITLTGPGLEQPVRNDDYASKDTAHLHLETGLVTHHADSYLLQELPLTGTYFVQIGDTQGKGGHDYGYRLRIGPAHPDFTLSMEPSGLHIAPGGTTAFTVRALRSDGFNGGILLKAKNLPGGFVMSKTEIPAGADIARFTITAPKKIDGKLVSPEITGTGTIAGRSVTRSAVPVDDQMQAFLYRHLVPARELALTPSSAGSPIAFEVKVTKSGGIELPLGEEVRIAFTGHAKAGNGKGMKLQLDHPPEGITLVKGWIARKEVDRQKGGGQRYGNGSVNGSIVLKADDPLKPGDAISVVVVAVQKRGKEEILYPAPALSVKIVKPRRD